MSSLATRAVIGLDILWYARLRCFRLPAVERHYDGQAVISDVTLIIESASMLSAVNWRRPELSNSATIKSS
jgi:hypothetical protein